MCTNGINPETLSSKQYLKLFAKGKCSPFMLFPSYTATKLVLLLKCEIMKKEHKNIFDICGWTHCEKKFYEFWKSVPNEEYLLWISNEYPFRLLTLSSQESLCLSQFLKLYVDLSKPIEDSIIEQKGFQVRIYGNSPKTEAKSECGNMTISKISPYHVQTKTSKIYENLFKMAKDLGYVRGLTYQSMPYDWRKSVKNNRLKELFLPNIKRIFDLTGKRIHLIGHSLGVQVIYNELLSLSQKNKDKYLKSWIGIGGSFLGSFIQSQYFVGGSDMFSFAHPWIGMQYEGYFEWVSNNFSTYENMPKDVYKRFEGEEWLKAIKKRNKYENGEISFEQSGFDFLPSMEDHCSPSQYDLGHKCKMGFYKSTLPYYVKIQEKTYTRNQNYEMLQDYGQHESILKFTKYTENFDLWKLKNPGLTYVAFTLRSLPTPETVIFGDEIIKCQQNKKICYPQYTYSYGDETVDTTSLLMAPLKWSYEYDNKKVPNAKPMKIIDICSYYNEKYIIYDDIKADQEYQFKKNEFIGISCQCMKAKNPHKCSHRFMVQDPHVLKLIFGIYYDNQQVLEDQYKKIDILMMNI